MRSLENPPVTLAGGLYEKPWSNTMVLTRAWSIFRKSYRRVTSSVSDGGSTEHRRTAPDFEGGALPAGCPRFCGRHASEREGSLPNAADRDELDAGSPRELLRLRRVAKRRIEPFRLAGAAAALCSCWTAGRPTALAWCFTCATTRDDVTSTPPSPECGVTRASRTPLVRVRSAACTSTSRGVNSRDSASRLSRFQT